MKKIIVSFSIIGVVSAFAIGGTIAFFSDTETSTGNTFTAGTLDLKVGGQDDPNVVALNIGPMAPGDSAAYNTWAVTNAGNILGDLRLTVSAITDLENNNPEPETNTADPGDLSGQLTVILFEDVNNNGVFDGADVELYGDGAGGMALLSGMPGNYNPSDPAINSGSTVSIILGYQLPNLANNNDVQGDSSSFNIEFRLSQAAASTVLIVSDDDAEGYYDYMTSVDYYSSILTNAGYIVTTWVESVDDNPTLSDLQSYDAVVWTCGDFYDYCPDETDAETLQDFIDQGGKLMISGAWILYDWYESDFTYNVLHSEYPGYAYMYDVKAIDDSHPIAAGFTNGQVIDFISSPGGNDYNPDYISDVTTDDQDDTSNYGIAVFATGPSSEYEDYYSIVAYEDSMSGAKIVYESFPLFLWPEAERTQFVENVMTWFGL